MGDLKSGQESMEDNALMRNYTKANKTKCSNRCLGFLKANLLVFLMLIGVVVGAITGIGLNKSDPKLTQPQILYLRFPGDIFIQSMKMLLIPIVVSSLLCSTAEIDIRSSGKIGLRALVYYLSTLVLASTLGIILAITVRPGERTNDATASGDKQASPPSSSPGLAFMDLFRNMVPDNLIEMFFTSKKTKSAIGFIEATTYPSNSSVSEYTTGNFSSSGFKKNHEILIVEKENGINMIGLIVTSIVFGCITSVVGNEAKPFLDFFNAVRTISFRLVAIFIWYSPVGIAFLIAAKMAEMENPAKSLHDLGLLMITAIGGFIIHGYLVLSLIYFILVRKNPIRFISGMIPALLFAFGSDSSSATLPVTIRCLESKNIDPRVTKLVTSVGATVNMDGACLYFTMVAVFVAQSHDIPLSAGQLVTISIVALSVSIGSAGTPGTGVIFVLMTVTSVGLPTEDISTVLAIDWFLSRCRTTINVLGDGIGAGIIEHLSRHELRRVRTELEPSSSNQNGETETPGL